MELSFFEELNFVRYGVHVVLPELCGTSINELAVQEVSTEMGLY